MKYSEYRLRVGDSVLGMRFRPARYAELFRDYFGSQSSAEKPDIILELDIGGRPAHPEIEDSLFLSKEVDERGFAMSGGLVRGCYDRYAKCARMRVHKVLTRVPTIRVFEQLLCQAFYALQHAQPEDAFLMHSSGVIRDGAGYLFAGPPGAGKSTIARLSLPDCILNDEINCVRFSGNEAEICSTPFNGTFKEKSEGRCALRAVLLLRQAAAHKLFRASGAEAVKSLMQEIIPPIGLDEAIDSRVRAEMLDIALRMQGSVPVYWLEFRQDPGFWELIDREIKR